LYGVGVDDEPRAAHAIGGLAVITLDNDQVTGLDVVEPSEWAAVLSAMTKDGEVASDAGVCRAQYRIIALRGGGYRHASCGTSGW